MHATDSVQRVRIYLSEHDDVGGQPLYLATLTMLREAGATGATALRGIAGFGASQRLRTDSGTGRSMPIVIEWIDRAERVARVLPLLDTLLPHALITIEDIQVYQATLRSSGPFGDQPVGELSARDVATITGQRSFADAIGLLLAGEQAVLPVLDERGRIIGMVGEAALRRPGLPPRTLLRMMDEAARARQIERVGATPLPEAMSAETRALASDTSVLQAAKVMVEWGLDHLPVVERDGRFFGLFGIDQALEAALAARTPEEGPIRNADQPTPLSLLMQANVQSVLGYALAADVIERLFALGEQPLFVVDNGRPMGLLTLEGVLAGLEEPRRAEFAAALLDEAQLGTLRSSLGETRVASLPLRPLPALPATADTYAAIAMLRDQGAPWLAVVDEQGRQIGAVGRWTILRALVQESGG